MQANFLAVGGVVLLLLLVSHFIRRAFTRHARARGADMGAAGTAGWLMFFGLVFIGVAALGMLNLSKFLNLAFSSTLLVFGVAALVGAVAIGRR